MLKIKPHWLDGVWLLGLKMIVFKSHQVSELARFL